MGLLRLQIKSQVSANEVSLVFSFLRFTTAKVEKIYTSHNTYF